MSMTAGDREGAMGTLDGLEPREVWRWFAGVCAIPRPSGSERRIADFIERFALARRLEHLRDAADNVLIKAPGRGAAASGPPLLLQAHLDMVPEKASGSTHDFERDGIVPVVDGDWVTSPETTLGADNGIGVALMLAVLDSDSIPHPPLECLFTTDEERGLTGAASLDPSWIIARRMINLDSEEEGDFCIGCAGGVDLTVEMPMERAPASGEVLELEISGMKGGHSGMAIVEGVGNAIRFLARTLLPLCRDHGCLLLSLQGGSKRNAIPRTASALITVPEGHEETVRKAVSMVEASLRSEYTGIDDGIRIEVRRSDSKELPFTPASGMRAIGLLLALPHGVQKMSGLIPGLVETSVNLAIASTTTDAMSVVLSARSPIGSAKQAVADRVEAIAGLSGCTFSRGEGYPGWMPDPASKLLARSMEVYSSVTGAEPHAVTIHAGLECGIIGDAVGGMDMISMGPDIRDVHVPGERASIPSLARFWRFFLALLARMDMEG
jgi:dipeptidase D